MLSYYLVTFGTKIYSFGTFRIDTELVFEIFWHCFGSFLSGSNNVFLVVLVTFEYFIGTFRCIMVAMGNALVVCEVVVAMYSR